MPLVPNEEKLEEHAFIIKGRVEGSRIDQYLAKRFSDYSRAFFQKLIKQEKVLVDGKSIKISSKIRAGQEVHISLPKLEALHLQPEHIQLDVLYEDDYLAVINKAAGYVVHPSRGHMSGTIVNALLSHFDELCDSDDGYRPGIVHRLDRDTTGVLLIAKTNQSLYKLSQQFENREIKKEYLALVEGVLQFGEGTINLPLGIDPRNRERMAIQHGGKQSVTDYRVLARYPKFTLVQVFPKTGRTHQIRIHFKSQGHPLVVDKIYGASPILTIDQLSEKNTQAAQGEPLIARQALHAWRIEFDHPAIHQKMTFCAPLARDFLDTLKIFQSLWPSASVSEILKQDKIS